MPVAPAQPFASFVQGLDAALALKRMKLDQKRQDLAQSYHEQLIEERQQAAEMRQQTAAAQLEEAKRHNEEMFESEMARLEQSGLNNATIADLKARHLTDLEAKDASIEAQKKQNEADKVANESAAATLKKSVADANQKAQMFREANDNRAAAIKEGLPTLQSNLKRLDALRADPTYNTDPSKQTEATRLMQENKKIQDSFNVPMPSAASDLQGGGSTPTGTPSAAPVQPGSSAPATQQPAAAALQPQAGALPSDAPKFQSIADVEKAFRSGQLNPDQAKQIIQSQFPQAASATSGSPPPVATAPMNSLASAASELAPKTGFDASQFDARTPNDAAIAARAKALGFSGSMPQSPLPPGVGDWLNQLKQSDPAKYQAIISTINPAGNQPTQ